MMLYRACSDLRAFIFLLLVVFTGCSQTAQITETGPSNSENLPFQTEPEQIRNAWTDLSIQHIFVVAHRANITADDGIPENSLPALKTAMNLGVDMAEIDLRETSDGHFVLMHDSDVDRTTNGTGDVEDMTLEEIRQLRLLQNGEETDIRVPTLEEVLELTSGKMMLNLDKIGSVLQPVLEIVDSYEMLDHVVLKSSDSPDEVAEQLEGLSGQLLFMPVISVEDYTDQELIQLISEYQENIGISAAELVFDDDIGERMTKILFNDIHELGVRVWINTLWNGRLSGGLADDDIPKKAEEVWGTLLKNGVDIIQTDQAAYFRAYISSPHFLMPE